MQSLFSYKDCLTPLNKIESITIFLNHKEGCKYTIAIPTYNRVSDLKLALESAINQNYVHDYNIIVVDNNPARNDDTELMMLKHYQHSDNVSYFKNTLNVGMINNWNKLFLLSDTEYVIMLHDDDVIFGNYLSVMDMILAVEGNVATINGGKKLWNGAKQLIENRICTEKSIEVYQYSKYSNYPFFHFGAPSGCLFSKSAFIEEGGFDTDAYPSSDYVFIQKLCLSGKKVLSVKDHMMLYRTGTNTTAKIETALAWLKIDKEIKEQLGGILHLPPFFVHIVEYFELKLRVRRVCKTKPNYKYERWTKGSKLFLVFFRIYRYLHVCTIKRKKINKGLMDL